MTTGLAPDPTRLPDIGPAPGPAAPRTDTAAGDRAEVNSGALLALAKSLSSQGRSDVSDSFLFAQLAANKAVDRFKDPAAWAAKLIDTLSAVGWAVTGQKTVSATTYPPPLDWRGIAEARFSLASGTSAPLVADAIAAAGRVTSGAPAAELWARQTSDGASGLFGIALADGDGSGSPRLSLLWTGFALTTSSPLILDWGSAAATSGGFVRLSLNTDVYAQVREQIITKLGNRITAEIRSVPL